MAGQALVHVLFLATLRGLCVRGPLVGKEHAFVLVHDWLPRPPKVDRGVALGELAGRYLAAHGPSTDRDLARWANLTLTDARAGLARVKAPVVEVAPLPRPTLLGAFDEVLMGWESRDLVLDGQNHVVTMNGVFKPIALVLGKAVASWSLPRGQVLLDPFAPLSTTVRSALERDARDVERFLAS